MKYHYVYIITNKLNHKFYIGKHSTNNLDDGYMGSGIAISEAIQKYGIENFSKRILCFCDSSQDAYKVEEFLVTKNLINREDCYNMVEGGRGNFTPDLKGEKNPMYGKHHSEEQKIKWSEKRKGVKLSEEAKRKISEKVTGEKNGFYGKHHSEEQKIKWSKMRKGVKPSLEARLKLSEANKRKHKYLTPTGDIQYMTKPQATRFHPDWKLIENK